VAEELLNQIMKRKTLRMRTFVVSFCFIRKQMLRIKKKERKSMTEPSFFYEAKGQVLVIHLPKELDHHNCRNLRHETDLLLSENYITRIVFDFSRTVFMDSSGIGIILNRYKEMVRSGGSVALYGADGQIWRMLMIGGITKLVSHYACKEDAITGKEAVR